MIDDEASGEQDLPLAFRRVHSGAGLLPSPYPAEQRVAQAFVVLFKIGDVGRGLVAYGALALVLPAALCRVLQRTGPANRGTKRGTKTIDFGAWGGTS